MNHRVCRNVQFLIAIAMYMHAHLHEYVLDKVLAQILVARQPTNLGMRNAYNINYFGNL